MPTTSRAPAFRWLDRNKTLAENTVNAGPVVLDSNVVLRNPDGTGFQGGSLNVKLVSPSAGDSLSIAEVGGITVRTSGGTTSVFYNGVRIGTETTTGTSLTVSFDQPVSDEAATALTRAIAFSTTNNAPPKTAQAVTFTATDAEKTSTTGTMQLKVKAESDAPVFTGLGPVSSHTPTTATAGVAIDGDAHVSNPDGTGFKGGKFSVHLSGATATDQLYLAKGPFSISGTLLMLDGTPVATVTSNGASGSDLAFSFRANAAISDAQMTSLLDQVSYRSTAKTPAPTSHDVTFSVTDAERTSTTAHVTLSFENAPPTLLPSSPTGPITLVSVSASGIGGNSGSSSPAVSPDGLLVAFVSGDELGTTPSRGNQVFVKNLATGAVTLVSASADGTPGNDSSAVRPYPDQIAFSADSQKVVFVSHASNLVPGDTNGTDDIFIKNLTTGAITRVSTDSTGAQLNASSESPSLSADGTKIAFVSGSGVPGDTSGARLYVKDLTTGTLTEVTKGSGPAGTSNGFNPAFSPDGTKLAFFAWGDTSGPDKDPFVQNLYIKDLVTGTVTLVATPSSSPERPYTPDGSAVPFTDERPVFSPDGTKIAYLSYENVELPSGIALWTAHLNVQDLQTGAITSLSAPPNALNPLNSSVDDSFSFSPDGTRIVFSAGPQRLSLSDDSDTRQFIYVADLKTGALTKIAPNNSGTSIDPVFAADGAHVIFTSTSGDLASNDGSSDKDVFIAAIPTASVTSATLTEDAARKTLNAAGTFYFSDAEAGDTHKVSVAAPSGALGTLSAQLVSDMNGTGAVVWSYVVDETKVEPLAAGQTKVETFALTLDDHHGGTVTQNVSITLTGTGGSAPMIASFALAPETTAAPASDPELWASAMASLSGVGGAPPGLFDVLEKRVAALEAAHAQGPTGAFEEAGIEIAHLAAQIDPTAAHVLETLWSDLSSHSAGTATAHQIADGVEAIASHLRDALHAGDPLFV